MKKKILPGEKTSNMSRKLKNILRMKAGSRVLRGWERSEKVCILRENDGKGIKNKGTRYQN